MHIGFTGTQVGMSERQKSALEQILDHVPDDTEFHHGDCIGADSDADILCGIVDPIIYIIIHPPLNDKKRAWCHGLILPAKDYLERNHDIVDACDILIAAPSGLTEELRSGTWATIRYARKVNKPTIILDP